MYLNLRKGLTGNFLSIIFSYGRVFKGDRFQYPIFVDVLSSGKSFLLNCFYLPEL